MTAPSYAVGFVYVFLLIQIIDCNNNFVPTLSDGTVFAGYGPFSVEYTNTAVCRGPKPVDVGAYSLLINKLDNGSSIAVINFTVSAAARLTEVSMTFSVIKGGARKDVWSYKISRPCQNAATSFFFAEHLDLKRCIIEKGNYTVVTNLSDVSNRMFRGAFFYGEFIVRVYVTATAGNVFCSVFKTVFRKKTL